MRHVILTCKNHPKLRWITKEIAVSDGKYNGHRSLFFMGEPVLDKDGKPKMNYDDSGLQCNEFIPVRDLTGSIVDYSEVKECECTLDCLEIAPEDSLVKRES
jgi:hypothetical protein